MPRTPAGRLKRLTEDALSIGADTQGDLAWRRLLAGPDEEPDSLSVDALLLRIGMAAALPAEIRIEVQLLESEKPDLFLRYLNVWEEAFEHRLRFDARWGHFTEVFKTEHLLSMEYCDNALESGRWQAVLEEDFVIEMLEGLVALRERVADAGLSVDVETFLLGHIDRMVEALRCYRLSGVGPVVTCLEAAIGAARLQPHVAEQVVKTEEGVEFRNRLGRVFAVIHAQGRHWIALAAGTVTDVFMLPEAYVSSDEEGSP